MYSLYIYHIPKSSRVLLPDWQARQPEGCFALETCLRYIAVSAIPQDMSGYEVPVESYEGEAAYAFLVRLSCGLLSHIVGEPEIFGQIKGAWNEFQAHHAMQARPLSPFMRMLFQDTKRIRSMYLQRVGQASYFTATEQLINLNRQDKVLIIGGGQFGTMLARKMAKRLANRGKQITISNRTSSPLQFLLSSMPDTISFVPYDANLQGAVEEADHVLIAIPSYADERMNRLIRDAWQAKSQHTGCLVHYCEYIDAPSSWCQLPFMYGIQDVIEMQETQSALQKAACRRARQAVDYAVTKRSHLFPQLNHTSYAAQTGNA